MSNLKAEKTFFLNWFYNVFKELYFDNSAICTLSAIFLLDFLLQLVEFLINLPIDVFILSIVVQKLKIEMKQSTNIQSTFITNHNYACKVNSHCIHKNMNLSVWCAKVFHPFAKKLCRDVSEEQFKTILHTVSMYIWGICWHRWYQTLAQTWRPYPLAWIKCNLLTGSIT